MDVRMSVCAGRWPAVRPASPRNWRGWGTPGAGCGSSSACWQT